MKHPVQPDGYNCGVIVIMMTKAVMKAFPKLPNMEFGTTPKEMAQERTALALEMLQTSVFDTENNCSMCLKHNPPRPGPSIKWVRCCFQLLCFVEFAGLKCILLVIQLVNSHRYLLSYSEFLQKL
ncbi:N-acetyltransferase 14 [Labeo rohita]|uniref:N-acetyltransferase 14 n=1 Tax=Labeo rohita TaxID=84645 RepID=A0ABQ8MMD6_LABRO|nr:N-acetyltransferase 14 [Labeo rohita]